MSNLAERTRTMDQWIRFLNLNRPLRDWGEPAPHASFPAAPLTPFCQAVHCRMSKGLTRERSYLTTRHSRYESTTLASSFFYVTPKHEIEKLF